MKKFAVLFVLTLIGFSAFAKKGAMILSGPSQLEIFAVSPNGKWVCGNIGDGTNTLIQGVLWNLESGEIIYLSTADQSSAGDVADDGTVAGAFTDYTVSGNGVGVYVPGVYRNGVWTRLDNSTIEGIGVDGSASGISQDGTVVVGYVMQGKEYKPAKWVNGRLERLYSSPYGDGICYAVSNDGKYATGYAEYPKATVGYNRDIAFWTDDSVEFLSEQPTFAEAGRKFSPDGKLLLCSSHGQYGGNFVYNIETKEKTSVPYLSPGNFRTFMCYVSNDGLVLGGESTQDPVTGLGGEYGYVYDGTQTMELTAWLKEKHNAVIDNNLHGIVCGKDMSDDGKVIAMLDYPKVDGVSTGDWSSVIVILDREVDICPPSALKAEKLRGVNSVRLTWGLPLMNAGNALGYNVYRDGVCIEEETGELVYIDAVPSEGEYSYTVTALYEDENGAEVESEHSVPVVIDVTAELPNMVNYIKTHPVSYNNLKLRWSIPASNLPSVTYFKYDEAITGFGGGVVSFSAAIRLPYDMVENYADNHVIARVSFMPRNPEARYSVKVYVNGEEKASKQADSETLNYGSMNIVDLDEAVSFGKYDDILIAVDVDASNFTKSSNDVIGATYGTVTDDFSDLLRQSTEPEYYSLNQRSVDISGSPMPVSWAIAAILTTLDEEGKTNLDCDVVAEYEIYRDDEKLSTVTSLEYVDRDIDAGNHTYGIAAKYADGSVSQPATINVEIAHRTEYLRGVENVEVNAYTDCIFASWNAPVGNDETVVSYAQGTPTGKGIRLAGAYEPMEYTVAHDYTYSYLEWYDGYNIEALRFYPNAEADYAIALEVDGIDVAFIEIGEMDTERGYKLKEWNTVNMDEPVKIEPGKTYRLKLVCSEVDPQEYAACVDDGAGLAGVSDLYSWDYSSFSSAYMDGSVKGSWMIGLVVADENSEPLPVDGYKVILDDDSDNAVAVTEPKYRQDGITWTEGDTHSMQVNAVYNVAGGELEIEGERQIFNVKSGVESIEVDRLKVYPNPATSYIKVEGAAEKLILIDMSGRPVAQTTADVIDVTTIPIGNYLLNIYNGGEVSTVKVMIVR